MELKLLTYVAVGLSFALYIAIAIKARAASTGDFYVAGAEYVDLLAQFMKVTIQGCRGTSHEVNQTFGVQLLHVLQGDSGGCSAAQTFDYFYGFFERNRREDRYLCICVWRRSWSH